MAQKIDELQLGITSDAKSAIDQLGKLSTSLEKAANAANSLSGTGGSLSGLAQSLSQLSNIDVSKTADGLKALTSVNFRKLANKKVKLDIDISGDGVSKLERLSNINFSSIGNLKMKDTGITPVINAVKKLSEVDTSKFDVNFFKSLGDMFSGLSKSGGLSREVNYFVASLSKLAAAGDDTKKSAAGLKLLTPELQNTITVFQNVGDVDKTIIQFVSSLAKLSTAGDKTVKTAGGLKALTQAVLDFITTLQNAPQISANLAMTIQGLGNLAAAGQSTGKALRSLGSSGATGGGLLGNMLGTAANSATSALRSVLSYSVQLGGKGASAIGTFMQKLGLFPGHANGVDRMALSFSNLLRAVLPFYGIRGVFDWLKESVGLGSSIVEIENVVDTAFGDLKQGYEDISGYVYKWAKTTTESFGVSELAAMQYAGRLQSIFNSSGFDVTEGMRDSAAKMSTELIERAGDVASFYDITVDEAMTKFQSGLAGMTRPLRSIGVNMSVANLEAFALSQGITQSWQSMDQATQMALRYQYILDATQYAQGDFQRTSQSMANQLRLLQLNFQMLSTTIGQGMVSAIAPVLSWLNALIRMLIAAANAFKTFMWTLFGKPLGAAKGIADDLLGTVDDVSDSLGSAGGGAADGLGGAADAAKDLKKQLTVLPFDELNQLAKDTSSASSGGSGGGGGGGGLGSFDTSSLVPDFSDDLANSPVVQAINKWAQKIRESFLNKDWEGLGTNIAYMLNAGFRYIYEALEWSKWKGKVEGFIKPFHTTINTMMDKLDWGLIGATFARGLNDIVYILRTWINGFEWRRYGQLFALGLNSMINEWDADAFGRLIADKFKMAWDFFGGWVSTFNFSSFGTKLKEMVRGAIDELDFKDMGTSFARLINGISDTIISFLEDGTIRDDLANAFSSLVNGFIEEFDEEDAARALTLLRTTLTGALTKAIGKIDKSKLTYKLSTVFSSLPWGEIALAVGAKAGATLAIGIFGTAFKNKAVSIISGLTVGSGNTGATTASTVSSAASATTSATTTTAGTVGAVGTGMSVGSMIAGTGIFAGLTALGVAMRKFADEHGGVKQGANLNTDQSFGTTPTAPKATNGAGYSTQIQTQPIVASPSTTKATQIVETVMTGKKDPSFTLLETAKASLMQTPIVNKTMNGTTTNLFEAGYKKFTDTKAYNTIKGFGASISNTFSTWWERNIDKTDYKSTKSMKASIGEKLSTWWFRNIDQKNYKSSKSMTASIGSLFSTWWPRNINQTNYKSTKGMNASIGSLFSTWWPRNINQTNYKSTKGMDANPTSVLKTWWGHLVDQGHYTATKWFKGEDKGHFTDFVDKWKNLHDKWVDVNVSIVKKTSNLGAWIKGTWEKLVEFSWFASGGLFNSASLIGVGEAGAEAVLPLTNQRTMRMIGNAITNAGGLSTGSNSELATEIARQMAPVVMSIVASQTQRPINVNATLYTEDNEVLARAVNSGNKSLDKRYHPVAQYNY